MDCVAVKRYNGTAEVILRENGKIVTKPFDTPDDLIQWTLENGFYITWWYGDSKRNVINGGNHAEASITREARSSS